MTSFAQRVLSVVRAIPAGRVATYGDVALMAGRPGAARAVGTVMRKCGDPAIPCHRVIAAGGAIGGFGGNTHVKRQRLAADGVTLSGHRVRQFATLRWAGGETVAKRSGRPSARPEPQRR